MLIFTICIIFCQNTAVLLQHASSNLTTNKIPYQSPSLTNLNYETSTVPTIPNRSSMVPEAKIPDGPPSFNDVEYEMNTGPEIPNGSSSLKNMSNEMNTKTEISTESSSEKNMDNKMANVGEIPKDTRNEMNTEIPVESSSFKNEEYEMSETPDESSSDPNLDNDITTHAEVPDEFSSVTNLDSKINTTSNLPVKCTSSIDNLKITPDTPSMTAYLKWDFNKTDACEYKYKVTTTTVDPEMVITTDYVTEQDYTAKNITPCVSYNFTVELQQQSDEKTLFALFDVLETDIPEEDKVNNVTYTVTTDSIFLNWDPSPNAQICKLEYEITVVNFTTSMDKIPYFRVEPNSKHTITSLSSCTYYNVIIQASGLRKHDEKGKDPLMYVIGTLPEHVEDIRLDVNGNYSRITWNPPSNQECLRGYSISSTDFNITTLATYYEINHNLICHTIVIYPISKNNERGKPATILKPGLIQNLLSYALHDAVHLDWQPPVNNICVDGYLVKVTNHSEYFTNETSFMIENLTACTTYEIKLYAFTNRSDIGDPYIHYINTSAPNDVGSVENLTSTIDDKIVTLHWNPPSNAKTCNLTYLVEVLDEHGQIFSNNTTTQTNLTSDFTGAIYCKQYKLLVISLTQSGQSAPNTLSIAIPEVRTAPSCSAVSVNTTRAVVECKFEDYTKNVCPIERINVTCNDVITFAKNYDNLAEIDVAINGLHAYSEYTCTTVASTSFGDSALSKPFSFRTNEGVPDSPQVDQIESFTNTSFQIVWKEVENIRGVFKNYHIQVKSLGSTYFIPPECQRNETKTFDYDVFSNNTIFLFSEAFPSYLYKVAIQVATGAGYGSPSDNRYIYTRGGIPEDPRNTDYDLFPTFNFTRGTEYNVSVIIKWDHPCFTNGNVSHYQIDIVGISNVGDEIDDHLVEKNVSVNDPITNINYQYTLEHLKPAFHYNISIKVVTEENLKSLPEVIQFNSFESFPEAPTIKPIVNVTKNTFVIEWDKPKQKRGKLKWYVISVESIKPRYWVPMECVDSRRSNTVEVPGNENNYTYKRGTPYHTYNVSVAAVNRIDWSPSSEQKVISTLEAEPEEVRNLEVELEYSETENYSAVATIVFHHPCHTYGTIEGMEVILIDMDNGRRRYSYIDKVSEPYEKTFSDLLPERNYQVVVLVRTRTHRSKGKHYDFKTKAGIPPLQKQITSPVPQDSGTATFTLSKDIFDDSNGKILYYAIILGEIGNNEKSMFGKLRKADVWPELAENLTANGKGKPYQITPQFWNPFKDNDLTNVTITLGDDSFEGNKPLDQSVTYTFKVRSFTSDGYRDSPTVTFKIPNESKLSMILGLTFGIMGACVMIFVIFIIWKKRQNWNKKKESIKSIPLTPIPISISNFSQYYSDLHENGEKLKLEFSLLGSKSSEIIANFCDATLPANKKKNRYTNILPYDESRVKLQPDNEDEESTGDYINASYIKGYSGNVEYIATQGPLEHTVMDFWKMVIQENSSLIVMVAQFVEQNKDKCYKYFPNVHENMDLENGVAIRCCTELNFKNYVVRTFMIQTETQQWTATHLQFTDWPDFGCPVGTEVILEFCQLMRDHAERNQDPIIIHCSAGVGRTGTLIALDILLQAISSKSDIDIFGTVLNLRRDRKNMVQTEKQYLFIHNCIDDVIQNPASIKTGEEMFSNEPIYENLNDINKGQLDSNVQESKF